MKLAEKFFEWPKFFEQNRTSVRNFATKNKTQTTATFKKATAEIKTVEVFKG